MNQRIEKLAMEANNHQGNSFDLNYKELDVFLEKFAELIVRECASIVDQRPNVLIGQTTGGWLREHFGVTEDD